MRNKFLKMTFMALCLSTSSALHAMNPEDEVASCSFATIPYAGKYEIGRNKLYEQSSGNVTIRQEGDQLILENFTLVLGSHYHNHMLEVIKDILEVIKEPKEDWPFEIEHLRMANFILSALPTEVLQLKCLKSDEKVAQYVGVTRFGELNKKWDRVKSTTPNIHVRFQSEKSSCFEEIFTLVVESPFETALALPIEEFRLFKAGTAEHERLLSLWFAPAVWSSSSNTAPASSPPDLASSSSNSSSSPAPSIDPALELDPREFHMGKPSPYPTTGFSALEGTHRWTLGKNASISFEGIAHRPSRVSFFDTRGLITGSHTQDLTVRLNGEVVDRHVYKRGENNHTIDVALPKDGPATIVFEIPTAKSPFDLGISADKRKLGISFGEVHFSFE